MTIKNRPFVKTPEPIQCDPVEITPERDEELISFGDVAKIILRHPALVDGKTFSNPKHYVMMTLPGCLKFEFAAMSLLSAIEIVKKTIPDSIFEQGFKVV